MEKISRFLSKILRHCPEQIGISLDREGWARIDDLLRNSRAHGMAITRDQIMAVTVGTDKVRFEIAGNKIRALHGHSVAVDLGLETAEPPKFLYHGTATRFLNSIFREGLQPQKRQHVHLVETVEAAIKVGSRHGNPIVLQVPAQELFQQGHRFFSAGEGVWLTALIAPEWLRHG
jgi:putative RNA 2'-phosphotransferase